MDTATAATVHTPARWLHNGPARVLTCGLIAGSLSMALMARRGQLDNGQALQALNAPSHWLYGNRALEQTAPSRRYTGWGVLIHQASSLMWATLFDQLLRQRKQPASWPVLTTAAAGVSAVAALVDLRLVPHRLTPGFQHHLSSRSLALVYGAFGAGLLLGALLLPRPRPRA